MILKNKTEKKVKKEERKLENDPLLKKQEKMVNLSILLHMLKFL